MASQQAILLDIILLIPSLFSGVTRMFPRELEQLGDNFIFYAVAGILGYAVFQNAQGKPPDRVPVISEAAAMQIGPF